MYARNFPISPEYDNANSHKRLKTIEGFCINEDKEDGKLSFITYSLKKVIDLQFGMSFVHFYDTSILQAHMAPTQNYNICLGGVSPTYIAMENLSDKSMLIWSATLNSPVVLEIPC